jgi:hypothetical protein
MGLYSHWPRGWRCWYLARMGKQSRRPSRRTRRRRPDQASRQPTFAGLVDSFLKVGADLLVEDDPLSVEIIGSQVVSMLEPHLLDPRPEISHLDRLVTALSLEESEEALALLIAIASVAPDPTAVRARAACASLAAAGVHEPGWSGSVGRVELVDASAVTDELGDQDLILASFRHPGGAAHAISLTADHNYGGLFRQAAIGVDQDEVRSRWARISTLPLRPINRRDLARRWAAGTYWYRHYVEPPVYDEVPRLMPLLEARARALPKVSGPPIDWVETSDADRRALVDAFLASPHATALTAPGRDVLDVLLEYLLDFRLGHGEGDALRWSPIVVETFLVDFAPRKLSLDDTEVEVLPRLVRAWVRFAGESKGLSANLVAETIEAVDRFEPDFRAAARDDEQAGPAKLLVDKMTAEGVDVGDPAALQAWIEEFNRRPQEARDAVLGPRTRTAQSGADPLALDTAPISGR